MRRFVTLLLAVIMVLSFGMTSASAFMVTPKDGELETQVSPEGLLAQPEPRAVLTGDETLDFVENGEGEDNGTVWISWNTHAYSKYGCSTASINYSNPSSSNIGVTLAIGIFDENLITYFGTTFRTEEEINELAVKGYEALQSGLNISSATNLISEGHFVGMTEADVIALDKEALAASLAETGFLGLDKDTLMALTEEEVLGWDEVAKLTLAELGGYDMDQYYQEIGKTGVINPGYTLYEVDLYTLPGRISLAKGEYEVVFVLQGFDAIKNQLSDVIIHLPVILEVEEDLTEELMADYDITCATRIDDGKVHREEVVVEEVDESGEEVTEDEDIEVATPVEPEPEYRGVTVTSDD